MAKKQLNYKDLSPKELELLKEIYVNQKVESMNKNDLKNFAAENISLQIKNTIGEEEELEAWQEMEEFFKDEFENKIRDIKIKMEYQNETIKNDAEQQIKNLTKPKQEEKISDMWED